MSMPLVQLPSPPPPPPLSIPQQSYNHSSHTSVGPFIGVLVVVILLGILAGMIGRLCSGKTIMGHGQYDIESWAESKCSTCIDGRISPTLHPRLHVITTDSAQLPPPASSSPEETKPEEEQQQQQEEPQQQSTPSPHVHAQS